MAGIWQSERLVFRAVEEDDEPFLASVSADSESLTNATGTLPVPQGSKQAKSTRAHLDGSFMHAIICLPSSASNDTDTDNASAKPIPIGLIYLAGGDTTRHHRSADLNIRITRPYQSKGYGSEAIRWALKWAFRYAGVHRMGISSTSYNPKAFRLYQNLGFVMEGTMRHMLFFDGRFHDVHILSMLEDEWRKLYGKPEDSNDE